MSKEIATVDIPTELKDLLQPVEGYEHLDIDLNELYAANGKYTPEQKLYAVVCYMVEGNSVKASKMCGVPPDTIRWWKNQSVWWDSTMKECRRKYQDQLDSSLTKVIHKGAEVALDRLENGDEVVTKDGEVVRRAIGAKEAATVAAIFFDKRALVRGDPTSNPGGANSKKLAELQNDFEAFAKQVRKSGGMAKPIEGQVVSGAEVLNYEEKENERKPK